MFKDKSDRVRVQIHGPHENVKGANYHHLHIKNKKDEPLDKKLRVGDRESPDTHIAIDQSNVIIDKVKPK